jgi:hypothetical protein
MVAAARATGGTEYGTHRVRKARPREHLSASPVSFFGCGYAQRMRRGTRVLPLLVLAVLIAVNLVLLFLLFRPDRVLNARPADQDSRDDGLPMATSSPGITSSVSASSGPTTSVSPESSSNPASSTQPIKSVPVERLLLAISSRTAWRATVGNCNTPSQIERSTNGGATWKRIVRTSPAPIVMLGLEPGGHVFALGGTRGSCSVRYTAYASDGTVHASTSSAVGMWFRSPDDRDEINGPGGTKAAPCSDHVIDLAPFDLTRALVVCDNGEVMNTRNSGNTWRQAARIPNTLAVAAGRGRYWVAGVRKNCDGVAVQSLTEKNGSLTRGRTRCAAGLEVAAGQVAFDVAGDGTIWLWSGSRVVVSRDDGQRWK